MAIGDYPVEYNPKVHGPYDPARYYGKPDTPLSQVRLGELGSWISRRNKSPRAFVAACSRTFWMWQHKYMLGKNVGPAGLIQGAVLAMTAGYLVNWHRIHKHIQKKYH